MYIVKEIEGYTDKLIEVKRFNTAEEALAYWERMVNANRFAGVGGVYRHYYTYPKPE